MAQEDIVLRLGDIARVITVHVQYQDPTDGKLKDFDLTGYTMSVLFPDGTSPAATIALSTAVNGTFTISTVAADSAAVTAPVKYRFRAVKSTTNQYTWDGVLWEVKG